MSAMLADNYQLKWHSHNTHLQTSVATLHRKEAFTDVILATTDGHQFAAHKFILSTCSTYFQQLLNMNNNAGQLVVVLPAEICYKTIATLIEYMYSGEATVRNDLLNGVLKAGEILKVKGLCMADADKQKNGFSREEPLVVNTQRRSNAPLKTYKPPSRQNPTTKVQDNKSSASPSSQSPSTPTTAPVTTTGTGTVNGGLIVKSARELGVPNKEKKIAREKTAQFMENIEGGVKIKDEPEDWDEDRTVTDLNNMIETEMVIQPELYDTLESDTDREKNADGFYAPLTCDLCKETFKTPALWVRHVETHPQEELPPRKKRKANGEEVEYPALRCELCEEVYYDPGDWVKHIQSCHTDEQLKMNNSKGTKVDITKRPACTTLNTTESEKVKIEDSPTKEIDAPTTSTPDRQKRSANCQKACSICNKTFPSSASMMIHARTHTGERPYECKVCQKGFNVKSNLLRHMRTIHEDLVKEDASLIESLVDVPFTPSGVTSSTGEGKK